MGGVGGEEVSLLCVSINLKSVVVPSLASGAIDN